MVITSTWLQAGAIQPCDLLLNLVQVESQFQKVLHEPPDLYLGLFCVACKPRRCIAR